MLASSGCSHLLDNQGHPCPSKTIRSPGGDFDMLICDHEDRTEANMRNVWAGVEQYTHALEFVLETRGMQPFGDRWGDVSMVRTRLRTEDDKTFSGASMACFWHIDDNEMVILDEKEGHWEIVSQSCVGHEFMHAYDDLVLGETWSEWRVRAESGGPHHMLGRLAKEIWDEAGTLWLETAWDCGDGGLDPPPSYGGCR